MPHWVKHSLFRTGSTYLWNRLRQVKSLYCFYEPFHPELEKISPATPDPWSHDTVSTAWMHHPQLTAPYLAEYAPLLRKAERGVHGFQKSFGLDSFCNTEEQSKQSLYLDSLIAQAGEKRAVFQFNRTALRTRWFRKHYPQGLHLYLVRNPDHQFHSQMSLLRTLGLDTFHVMDLMAAALNRNAPEFLPLVRVLPLPGCRSEDFSMQRRFYSRVVSALSMRERYFLFYFLWFTALVENLSDPDDIFSIDALSLDENVRKSVEARLSDFVGEKIDFSDANARRYPSPPLPIEDCRILRRAAQSLVLSRMDSRGVKAGIAALSDELRHALLLDSALPESSPVHGELSIPGLRSRREIEDAQVDAIGSDMERKFQEGRLLRDILKSRGSGVTGVRTQELDEENLRKWKQRMDHLADQVYALKAEMADLQHRLSVARKAVDQARAAVRKSETQRDSVAADLERKEQDVRLLMAEMKRSENRIRELIDALTALKERNGMLDTQLNVIRSSRWYRWSKKLRILRDPE